MTVKELIKRLKKVPQEAEVYTRIIWLPDKKVCVVSRVIDAELRNGNCELMPWGIGDLSKSQIKLIQEYLEESDHGDTDT